LTRINFDANLKSYFDPYNLNYNFNLFKGADDEFLFIMAGKKNDILGKFFGCIVSDNSNPFFFLNLFPTSSRIIVVLSWIICLRLDGFADCLVADLLVLVWVL